MELAEINAIEKIDHRSTDDSRLVAKLRGYYELSKPGITQMVVLTAAAGYYLAVGDNSYFTTIPHLLHFVLCLMGTACISAGACSFNQYLERDADALMKRTSSRPIPSGLISPEHSLYFAIATSVIGAVALYFVDTISFVLALITHISYTVMYTPLKKKSWTAMLLGGVPGALPAMGGWTAGSHELSAGAWILFALMFLWQMPHFLALAIMYRIDYQRSGFALLGKGEGSSTMVAWHALAYSLALIPTGYMLYHENLVGSLYLIGFALLSFFFVWRAIAVTQDSSVSNARKLLLASYAFLMGVFLFMFVDKI